MEAQNFDYLIRDLNIGLDILQVLKEKLNEEDFISSLFSDSQGHNLKLILEAFINSHLNQRNCFTNELIFLLIKNLIKYGKNFNVMSLMLCEFILMKVESFIGLLKTYETMQQAFVMRKQTSEELFHYFLTSMIGNFKNTLMETFFWTVIRQSKPELVEQSLKEVILNIIIYVQQKIQAFERLSKFALHQIWNQKKQKEMIRQIKQGFYDIFPQETNLKELFGRYAFFDHPNKQYEQIFKEWFVVERKSLLEILLFFKQVDIEYFDQFFQQLSKFQERYVIFKKSLFPSEVSGSKYKSYLDKRILILDSFQSFEFEVSFPNYQHLIEEYFTKLNADQCFIDKQIYKLRKQKNRYF